MGTDVSIVFRGIDELTGAVNNIRNSNRGLNKDLEESSRKLQDYRKRQEEISKQMAKTQTSLYDAKKAVEAAKKAYAELNDETSREYLEKAQQAQNDLTATLREQQAAAKDTEKAIRNLHEQQRKMENQGSGGGGSGGRSGSGGGGGGPDTGGDGGSASTLGQLAKAGLTQMVGQSLSQIANAYVGSAYGSNAGTMFSGALSGVASGAALGSIIPGLGTAIGAAVGGLTGLANGATQVFGERDEAFKAYVQAQTEAQLAQRDSDLQSGSAIAAGREKDLISFSTLFKDRGTAEDYLKDLVTMANTTPFLYDDLTAMSKTLATYGYGAEGILPVLQTVGDAGAALGMATTDMNMVATALGRMKSSNKTSLEYLNILNDRGIGAVGMLSDAYGVDQGTMYDMISKGKVAGQDAVSIILEALTESFSGSMEEQSKTFSGLKSTLEGMEQELQNAYGEGYNAERNKGVKDQIDWLSGASGEAQEEANQAIGAWQASLENAKEKYVRDAVDAAMGSSEYQRAKARGDAADMGRIIMEAKVQGMNEYNAKEGRDEELAQVLSLAETIRGDTATNDAYWDAGYIKGQQYTKGFSKGLMEVLNTPIDELVFGPKPTGFEDRGTGSTGLSGGGFGGGSSAAGRYAWGLPRVPHDNFPAVLHEGERVLTAQQARAQDGGGAGGVTVTVTGNSFVGTGEEMADQLMRVIAAKVRRAGLLAEPG